MIKSELSSLKAHKRVRVRIHPLIIKLHLLWLLYIVGGGGGGGGVSIMIVIYKYTCYCGFHKVISDQCNSTSHAAHSLLILGYSFAIQLIL